MARFSGLRVLTLLAAVSLACLQPASAQVIFPIQPVVGGVAIDANGTIKNRTEDPTNDLATMRRRLKDSELAAPLREFKCISLPKLFGQARELLAAGKPLPDDIRYLGGLTQIRYVFVYPEQHDILIAGPSEEITAADTTEALGKTTGRPVLQFFDLVEAMRTVAQNQNGRDFFGCSIDPSGDVQAISDKVAKEYSSKPRGDLINAMTKAIGPQKVTIIGTADDTRFALTLVAADYKLKRFTMGLEHTPVEGIGHAVDDGRANGSRFWFEPLYEPLSVSADGNAYGITGQRLQVKAGPQSFQTTGVTEKARHFAELFTAKIPELAKVEPAIADLQNIADLALVAALIRHDQLDAKIGWDDSWCFDAKACPVPTIPVPRSADTVVAVLGNAVASGGVSFSLNPLIANSARAAAKDGAFPVSPTPPAGAAWQTQLAITPAKAAAPTAHSGVKP